MITLRGKGHLVGQRRVERDAAKTMRRNLLVMMTIIGELLACTGLSPGRVKHDPLTPEEHVTFGLAYEAKGRPELAAREYDAALQQEHSYLPAMVGLGNLAFERGALEEAEAYYQQALAIAPKDPGANNNLAMLYLTRGASLEEAEQLARQALEQGGPLRPYALDTLARIYARQRRYQEAQAALEEAQALAPSGNTLLRQRLVQLREELGGN